MPIQTNNLVLYKSERLTDNDDGGGKYSGQIIVDGQSNNLFDDISELDRTIGDVALRKIFPAVTTNDVDKLMGATVFISENPQDPNVSALLFSTENWTDERLSAQNRIENYLAKGAQIAGTPLDTHWQGMKSIQVAMFPSESESSIGATIVLISNEGKALQHEQYVRIISVDTRTAKLIIDGREVEYKIATYGINDPLDIDFVGLSAKQWYNGEKSTTIIRDTIVADTGKYYGSVKVTEDAAVGSFSVQAESIYSQIIPSAQTETPLIDIDAAGQSTALVPTKLTTITKSFNITVNTIQGFYFGSPVMPKSVEFNLFGLSVTDVGGELKNSNGTVIGAIDYQVGLITWNANAGTGTATINMTFKPAAKFTAPVESELIYVLPENNGFNWIRNLVPLPTPGSLQVSYMAQGKAYVLRDNGSGQLRGSDAAFGSGSINYETGTMSITTGALPDVYSGILITWSGNITTQERSNMPISKAYVEIPLADSIVAGSLSVNWLLNGVSKTATDNGSGQFTGDATGTIDYAEGVAKLMPALLPNGGTTFNVTGQKGTKKTLQVTATPNNGTVVVSLDNDTAPLVPKSVKVRVPIKYLTKTAEVDLYDAPVDATSGNLVTISGQIQGTINYNTRTITITPSVSIDETLRVEVVQPRITGVSPSIRNYQTVSDVQKFRNETTTNQYSLNGVATAITISVAYRDTSAAMSINETVVGTYLKTDLTEGYAEQILAESIRFTLGNSTYIDRIGSLYRNPSITTGAGTLSGQVRYGTGEIEITSWDVGATNSPVLESLATQLEGVKTNQVSFRAPTIPIRSQSLTVSATKVEGGVLNIMPDVDGGVNTAECDGFFNFDQGYGQFVFREKIQITTANRAEIEAQSWYDVIMEYQENGSTYIHKPIYVLPESIRYNAVAYSYIPLDSDILGLSATRLPLDGRVPIFRMGETGIISASKTQQLPTAVAGQTYDLTDQRISYCELEDSTGVKVNYTLYSVDYDYGRVTLGGDFAVGSLTLPLIAKYRYQDMLLVRDVQINGQITFTKPLTHNYAAANSIIGSALVIGDMQSRYTRKFAQTAWSSVWADAPTGAAISANYNDALYPIAVTNNGAIQERWALVFTDTTNFRIIGEYSGQIGTGSVNVDCAPLNPVTNAPYFTVKKEGWGSGWASGNVLRFNTIAANFPVWCIRTVKQSEPNVMSDQFQIMFRGDIDRVI